MALGSSTSRSSCSAAKARGADAASGDAREPQGDQAPARARAAAARGARRAGVPARERDPARRGPAAGGGTRRGGDGRHAGRAAATPSAQARPPTSTDRAAQAARRRTRGSGAQDARTIERCVGRCCASSAACASARSTGDCPNGRHRPRRARPAANLPRRAQAQAARRARKGAARAPRTLGANGSRTYATPPRSSANGRSRAAPTGSPNCSARSTIWWCSPAYSPARPSAFQRQARQAGAQGPAQADRTPRRRLRKRALREGERLYGRRPKKFARRVSRAHARTRD